MWLASSSRAWSVVAGHARNSHSRLYPKLPPSFPSRHIVSGLSRKMDPGSQRHHSHGATSCGCAARKTTRTAYIALGSNLGDRVGMIEQACKEMDSRGIKVKRTSSLWETEPMYVLDQDRFVNGACEVRLSYSNPPVLATECMLNVSLGRDCPRAHTSLGPVAGY